MPGRGCLRRWRLSGRRLVAINGGHVPPQPLRQVMSEWQIWRSFRVTSTLSNRGRAVQGFDLQRIAMGMKLTAALIWAGGLLLGFWPSSLGRGALGCKGVNAAALEKRARTQ